MWVCENDLLWSQPKTVPKSNTIILEKISVAVDSKIKKLDYVLQELALKNEIHHLGGYMSSTLGISQSSTDTFYSQENHMSSCVDKHNVSDLKGSEA